MFITALNNQMSIYFSVCYIAGEFIQHLRKKIDHINKNREEKGLKKLEENIEILPKEEYCVRVAALCHDLGKCELV